MEKIIEKANILLEALPYIKSFNKKTIVIKYGGSAMIDENLKNNFALDVVMLKYIGLNPVIVHGGGPQIGATLERMGKKTEFVGGLRVTDPETMEIVQMVLGGKINKEIITLINQHGGKAVGISGKDGELIRARKYKADQKSGVNLGMVGEVEKIDPKIIHTLDEGGFIPVIAPVGFGAEGESYNINADFVAGHIAGALQAEKLVLLTDVAGILNKEKQLIPTLNQKQVKKLIGDKTIFGGMLPKVESCLIALKQGVKKTHIIDGRVKHAVLLEIFTNQGIGTEISE